MAGGGGTPSPDEILAAMKKGGASKGEMEKWNALSDAQRRRNVGKLRNVKLGKGYSVVEDGTIVGPGFDTVTSVDISGARGLLPKALLRGMRVNESEITRLTTRIDEQAMIDASPRSPAGEELSAGERMFEIALYGAKLTNQTELRKRLRRALDLTPNDQVNKERRKGYRKRLTELIGVSGDYGQIGETKDAIYALEHPEVAVGPGLEAQLADVAELLRVERRRSALLAGQYGVIPGILASLGTPFVGAYQAGGVVPRDGLAYVHGGETIVPSPGITINLSGDLAAIVKAEVAGQARLVDKQVGARSRRLAIAPGQA